MSKNVLIITSSLRKNSNSEMLVDAFMRGAEEAGHPALNTAYNAGRQI